VRKKDIDIEAGLQYISASLPVSKQIEQQEQATAGGKEKVKKAIF